jgi:hypothetical protein
MHTYPPVDLLRDYSFSELLSLSRLTKDQAAELFCRSKRSIHRWQQDTPQHAVNLLIIKAGYLGALSEDWDGWRLFGRINGVSVIDSYSPCILPTCGHLPDPTE